MLSKVYSAVVVGVEAFEVEIEVHAGWVLDLLTLGDVTNRAGDQYPLLGFVNASEAK